MDLPSFVGYALEAGKPKELGVPAGCTLALKQVALAKPLEAGKSAVVSVRTMASKQEFVVCSLSNSTPQCTVELLFSPGDGGVITLTAPKGCTVHVSAAQFEDDFGEDDEDDGEEAMMDKMEEGEEDEGEEEEEDDEEEDAVLQRALEHADDDDEGEVRPTLHI